REILRNRYKRRRRPSRSNALPRPRRPRKPEIREILAATKEETPGTDQSNVRWKKYQEALEAFYASKWKDRWEKSEKGRGIALFHPQPTKKALRLYKGRTKPFSSILIQLRTGKIGLNAFLKH